MPLLTVSNYDKLVGSSRESLKTDETISEVNSFNKRILIVEDNDLNRQMLDDYLSFSGYQVFSLASGSDFFQALAAFKPHIILLDLKLPDIDGYALLQQLHQIPDWQHIPVIVVSAFAFRADQQRALSLGASRYLVKPVNLKDLKKAIQDELSGHTT